MKIGKRASLTVIRIEPEDLILDGFDGEGGPSIRLPRRLAPREAAVGDRIDVFVHSNAEGAPIATTETPHAQADEFAYLEVKEVGRLGAFLDWGIGKDLLLPHGAQATKVEEPGRSLVVRVLCDPVSGRMMASSKLRRFLSPPPRGLERGRPVELLFYEVTDLGVNAIVDQSFSGLLHLSPGEAAPAVGDRRTGYIEEIRADGKVDLCLHRGGSAARCDATQTLLAALRHAGGRLALGDKSDPAAIRETLGLSKKAFKKAAGGLLRARRIRISDHEIALATATRKSSRSRRGSD